MRVWILTVSDRAFAGEREDGSGPALAREVEGRGWTAAGVRVVPDDRAAIEEALRRLVDEEGATQVANVGRCKIEKRPLMLVIAEVDGKRITTILQNAETIRLVQPGGKSVSVASLTPGTEVLVHREAGGRHFGMKIEETLEEK